MAKMKKLFKRLTAWLDVPGQEKTKSFGISKMPIKSAAMTFSKNRWNSTNLRYFDLFFDKLYLDSNIITVNKKTWIQNMYLFMD